MLWDLNDGKHLHTLDHNDIITALCFSPNRYWLCAAFGPSIKIWVICFSLCVCVCVCKFLQSLVIIITINDKIYFSALCSVTSKLLC